MLYQLRTILLFFLLLGMVGCTTVAPPSSSSSQTPKVPWKKREMMLSELNRWQLSGKIAVQTSHDSGSASVDWIQNARQYNISLMGPLGAGAMKLNGANSHATLQTADGKQLTANNAEELLAKGWGFHLPISHLNYWIRGIPVPGIPYSSQFDGAERLSTLSQQGWYIQFQNYTRVGMLDLPSRLSITSPQLRAKIVIYQWRI